MPSPATPLQRTQSNRRGIIAIALAMASFVANDAIVKTVSESLPAAQLIFIRGFMATLMLLAVAQAMGLLRPAPGHVKALRHLLDRRVLQRSLLDALGTLTYLGSLFHMPIGNATAISMATPLFITVFAVLAWRERVLPARWLAIAGGFVGVLLIVQPAADAFNAWSLLCVTGALIHTGRDLMTRVIPESVPPILMTVSTSATVTLLSGALVVWQSWHSVNPQQMALLLGASAFLSVAYYLIIIAMRSGELSVVAPFRYTGLLFALALGWAVWGEVPNPMACAGIVLVVGAGLYMLTGQRRG